MNIVDNFDLFIFDLDDTIVETDQYHYASWLHTFKKFINDDFYIDYNFFCKKFHSLIENNIKIYLEEELKLKNYEEIINYKNKHYISLIKNNKIKLIEGFDKLINKIINEKKIFVIVTNSPKEQLEVFLNMFPILQKSSKNYYRELLEKKKPNPECYIKVVNDFPYKKMVGFEDSLTGIHSISQVPEILTYFINNSNYLHYDYINKNYKIKHINNYLELN